MIAPQVLAVINELAGKLGYLPVDDDWGTVSAADWTCGCIGSRQRVGRCQRAGACRPGRSGSLG